jgi:hypothetical protein
MKDFFEFPEHERRKKMKVLYDLAPGRTSSFRSAAAATGASSRGRSPVVGLSESVKIQHR